MEQEKKSSFKWLLLGIFVLSIGIIFFSSYVETNSSVVNLALKKNDKTYVFCKAGTAGVQYSLDRNESPSILGFIQIFEENNNLYADPIHIREITNILCGNYIIHNFKEHSYDGYVTSGQQNCFKNTFKNKSTENIGEQVRINTVELTNLESGNMHHISWEYNLKEDESRALKNCEDKSFMITTRVQPGETVMAPKDFIMVNLEGLVEFYGNTSRLKLNKEQGLLYIIQK